MEDKSFLFTRRKHYGTGVFTEFKHQNLIRQALGLNTLNSAINLRVAGIISLDDHSRKEQLIRINIPVFGYDRPYNKRQADFNNSFAEFLDDLRADTRFMVEWTYVSKRRGMLREFISSFYNEREGHRDFILQPNENKYSLSYIDHNNTSVHRIG